MNGKAPEPSSRNEQVFRELYASRYLSEELISKRYLYENQKNDQ